MKMNPILLAPLLLLGALLPRKAARSAAGGIRQKVVSIARTQLGADDPRPYIEDALGRWVDVEWCGLFVLWALHMAGLGLGVHWKLGEGFASRHLKPILAKDLKPGDVIYFHRPYQHHAMVEWVNHETGMMGTINGNGTGGAVTYVERPIGDADNYYSIDPWIEQAEQLQRAA